MAKVLFGGGVANIQGSIAGNTFTRTKAGPAARNKVKPNNPATKAQMAQRQLISRLSQAWRQLTEEQRIAWNVEAKENKRKGVCGNNIEMTGHQLYVRVNSMREANNDVSTPASDIAIYPEFIGQVFGDTDPTCDISDSFVQVPLGANAVADLNVAIWATGPRSAGKLAHKGSMGKIYTAALSADDITAGYIELFTGWTAKYGVLTGTAGKAITFSCREYQSGHYSYPVLLKGTIVA